MGVMVRVFILLLFFMLASNFNRWQQLPIASVKQTGLTSTLSNTINLQLYPDSSLQIDGGQRFVMDDWGWLSVLLAQDDGVVFKITAEDNVSVQLLIDTVDRLQQRGVSSVSFGLLP